jgi:hypothetical protein
MSHNAENEYEYEPTMDHFFSVIHECEVCTTVWFAKTPELSNPCTRKYRQRRTCVDRGAKRSLRVCSALLDKSQGDYQATITAIRTHHARAPHHSLSYRNDTHTAKWVLQDIDKRVGKLGGG